MHSTLTVATYRHLLRTPPSNREEDTFDLQQHLQYALDLDDAPGSRFEALKAAVRRKRKRPTPLTPLIPPQHSSQRVDQQAIHEDRHEASHVGAITSSMTPALPPLAVNVLQRQKLFLSPNGEPVVGIEEILQLQELNLSPPPKRASPLQLIAVPRKVFEDDEVALMPCHTIHYRHAPSLVVERWKEPIRDRDKNWRNDELHMILATMGSTRESHKLNKMTRNHEHKGAWRRLDFQRLQVKATPLRIGVLSESAVTTLPTEVLLRSQGAMISRTYCIVTIYGIGIYGRLHAEGLDERRGRDRYLKVDAYDPLTCRVMSLRVSMVDLEWVFEGQPELLVAGKKQTVLRKVVSLLYFKYPDDDIASRRGDDQPHEQAVLHIETKPLPVRDASLRDVSLSDADAVVSTEAVPGLVLCISPHDKINEAARRRLEREQRLRNQEQERLRLLALLMKMPKRARHRVVFQLYRMSGHEFLVSIYHFPTQVRNFVVVAYNPQTCRTFTIIVGVMEAAAISRIFAMPHKWTPDQKQQIAKALVPRLQLRVSKSKAAGVTSNEAEEYRVALAIREDRMGAQGSMLPLPLPAHSNSRKDSAVAKFKKDGQQELQITLDAQLQEIRATAIKKIEQLAKDIQHAEATIAALKLKDAELKEKIEDINSGKGIPVAALAEESMSQTREKPQHHETRRGLKAARNTIKDENKALQARVLAWKKELDVARELEITETDKAQTRHAKALELLTQKAITATLPLWFDPRDRKEPVQQTRPNANHQRTKLHRAEIREGFRSVASGACHVLGRKYRFTVFAELPKPVLLRLRKRVVTEEVVLRSAPWIEHTRSTGRVGGDDNEEAETTDAADEAREEEGEGGAGQKEEEEEEREEGEVKVVEPVDFGDPIRWLELVLYDAFTSQPLCLRLTRLEFIALTKPQHDALLNIVALDIATSPVGKRIRELDASYEAMRSAMAALRRLKKNDKKRKQMAGELTKNRHERRALMHDGALWRVVVNELCARVRMADDAGTLEMDRCIYKATLSIVSLTVGSDSADGDEVVDCEVWATLCVDMVSFHARDLTTNEVWTLEYPDSVELVKEFAVESCVELQLHIEAIAMTLLLYTDEHEASMDSSEKGRRQMRFEE